MEKLKGGHRAATPTCSSKTRNKRESKSAAFLNVLPELWALIASFSSPPHPGPLIRKLRVGVRGGIASSAGNSEDLVSVQTRFAVELRELFVSSRGMSNSDFNFIKIPGLEILGCRLALRFKETDVKGASMLCSKLADPMQKLPSASPLLHSLHLNLCLDYFEGRFPQAAYTDLVATINRIRLPNLNALTVSIYCLDRVSAHPEIPDLAFEGCGLAHIHKEHADSFPRIRSFTGSLNHCDIICIVHPNLDQVSLTFEKNAEMDQDHLFTSVPPIPQRSVTRVTIRAVDEGEDIIKSARKLGPHFYSRLTSFFPHITHLDIVLGRRLVTLLTTK
ncbi:hypothetical protein C8J57DRAFT_1712056 [Mycena rebaudengoi]|nr:hypothetical protein C8J57DRAFT_1712056 [Mycena rebaudengoi]